MIGWGLGAHSNRMIEPSSSAWSWFRRAFAAPWAVRKWMSPWVSPGWMSIYVYDGWGLDGILGWLDWVFHGFFFFGRKEGGERWEVSKWILVEENPKQ